MNDFHTCRFPSGGRPPQEYLCTCGQWWMLVKRPSWQRKTHALYGWVRISKKRLR